MDFNPFESPKVSTTKQVEAFSVDRLPLVFTLPARWKLYWGAMTWGALVTVGISAFSAIPMFKRQPFGVSLLCLGLFVICLFWLALCVSALLSRLTITKEGFEVMRFGRLTKWNEISSWTAEPKKPLVLHFKNGRRKKFFCAAGYIRSRRAIFISALEHFCRSFDPVEKT